MIILIINKYLRFPAKARNLPHSFVLFCPLFSAGLEDRMLWVKVFKFTFLVELFVAFTEVDAKMSVIIP